EEITSGVRLLAEIFAKSGVEITKSSRPWREREAMYFEFGTKERTANIAITDNYLSDLPGTREHREAVESFARTVAGRSRYGSPAEYHCRCGVPISIAVHWPIETGFRLDNQLVSWLIVAVTNELDDTEAICSVQMPSHEFPSPSPFLRMEQLANSLRYAIDEGSVRFVPRGTHSSNCQIVDLRNPGGTSAATEDTIQQFIKEKAYYLGFRASHTPHPIWIPDPWDATYLGTTVRALSQAAIVAQARKLITLDSTSQYASPSDKLLSDGLDDKPEGSRQWQKLSLSTMPNKANFESHVASQLEKGAELALIFIDLDHFKEVNDTQGHQAGDDCLEKAIQAMGTAIGSKGTLYRWGGDEFAVCLPDFSTEEAKATAERIRQSIENSKAGGPIAVTASVGVCATDQVATDSPATFIKNADDAMYTSKKAGRNGVTVAYKTGPRTIKRRTFI
ncbi:MAG: GGDEF domain-containing protein, partial [Acidobacteriaceae bacterium]